MRAIIKDVAYYVPKNEVSNEYFIELYKEKYGKDISKLLENMGRNKRRICDDEEDILTMALESTKKVLEENNLTSQDIDMIVFSTGTPKYIHPCNAIKLHNLLGCKKNVMVYDLNASCVGMLVGLTQVSNIIENNSKIKYALVVGSEETFSFSDENHIMSFVNTGESACTILLENVDCDDKGLIEYDYYTDSSLHDKIVFPRNGLKESMLTTEENYIHWYPFSAESIYEPAIESIGICLKRHGLKPNQVKRYFISQLTPQGINIIAEGLGEDRNKFEYIGDKYGYTATTSPFIALKHSLERGDIENGDIVVFWSVGAGITCHTSIFRF